MPTVSANDVSTAMGGNRSRVGFSAYYLEKGGISIKLTDGRGDQVGSVRFSEGHGRLNIETINVSHDRQGRGLGKLLVAALCDLATQMGLTRLGLATPDTSGGFWAHYGVGMGGGTLITNISALVWQTGSINLT
jgi:GNAT superfamily N-acetyltransferase